MNFFRHKNSIIHYKWLNNDSPTTFLLINSLGTDFRIWDAVAKMIASQGNVLLFDKRGHGLSDVVDATNGLNDFVADIEALLEYLHIVKLNIVGLSVGGMIAQLMAHKNPGMVEKLVLCDTAHIIGTAQGWDDRISKVLQQGLASISGALMQQWFSERFREREAASVSGYRNMLERTPVTGYIHTCEGIRDADLTAVASGINVPTLCLVGSEDRSTSPDMVKALSNLIEGSHYEVIVDSGHIPCVDNPVKLSTLILDFVK